LSGHAGAGWGKAGVIWGIYMLIDQDNPDVLPLTDKLIESLLDSRHLGFGVHDEEIL